MNPQVVRLILSWRLSECRPGLYDGTWRRLGCKFTLCWRPHKGARLGTPLREMRHGCFHCCLCHHLLLKEKKCSFLSASNSDLPLVATWSVPFLAPKQSQAIKFGSTRADRGWMVISFLYLLAAYLVQQALRENFLINRALSWRHMYTASGHYKSVVIALRLGKSPGAAVLLGKQSWRKAGKETGLHSKGCLLS